MKRILPLFFCLILLFCPQVGVTDCCLAYQMQQQTFKLSLGEEVVESLSSSKDYDLQILCEKLLSMGFDDCIICKYIFDNFDSKIEYISKKYDLPSKNSSLVIEGGRAVATKSAKGKSLDRNGLCSKIVQNILTGKFQTGLEFVQTEPQVSMEENSQFTNKRSSFTTYITGNNQEGRINNIAVALGCFDGFVVEDGQTISFNSIVGETTQEKGYLPAKIILNGKYIDDFGGGVCQASTTLYNALLVAGVDVIEANPHSLKVGYVEGAFDAMVATGVSDMVFQNNTGGKIIISTYCTQYECGASVFGIQNEYEIKRRSEKIEFEEEDFPKLASKYDGYLEYYKGDQKVFEKRIRKNGYFKKNIEV